MSRLGPRRRAHTPPQARLTGQSFSTPSGRAGPACRPETARPTGHTSRRDVQDGPHKRAVRFVTGESCVGHGTNRPASTVVGTTRGPVPARSRRAHTAARGAAGWSHVSPGRSGHTAQKGRAVRDRRVVCRSRHAAAGLNGRRDHTRPPPGPKPAVDRHSDCHDGAAPHTNARRTSFRTVVERRRSPTHPRPRQAVGHSRPALRATATGLCALSD